MSEGIVWLRRIAELVFALALLGGAFALWSRAKGAALCGAAAGAFLIVFSIIGVVFDYALRSTSQSSLVTTRILYSLTFGLGTVLHYALLITMVILLARKAKA
jgi:hypothetical protein